MKALSLHQPWASLVSHGTKRVENRTWKPPAWVVGQRIAIHASRKSHEDGPWSSLPEGFTPPVGAVVRTAVVRGHVTESDDEWFRGPVGWLLGDVDTLPEPVPCRGMQGLWDLPHDVERRIAAISGLAAKEG